jgi:riboflavin biosynthesis pyrimidine reductase
MGLLRACADAVLIGAETMRATPGHIWTPAHVYPALAADFAELRAGLGRRPEPQLVVLTASGDLDFSNPALVKGAIVLTTRAVARTIGDRLPQACELVALAGSEQLDLAEVIAHLRARGLQFVLVEGGPHVMGGLMEKGLLDEAFLTISPVVAGRASERRLGMVEGVELLPARGVWSRLLSLRRHGGYVFLRYGLRVAGASS